MSNKPTNNELRMLSRDEMISRGWKIPSSEEFLKNMNNRLMEIRGEKTDNESFLQRFNYNTNSNSCNA